MSCRKHSEMSVTKKRRRARNGRRGQIMVILALAAVGLVGIAALGIDVFYIYWNKNRLQSGTDAAALAGATYFSNVTFSGKNALCLYATDAQNAACTYALNNGVVLSELTGRGRQCGCSVDYCQRLAHGVRDVRQSRGHPKLYRERHFRGGAAGHKFCGWRRSDRPRLADPLYLWAVDQPTHEQLRCGLLAGPRSAEF